MKKLLAPLLLSAGALTFNGCITAIRQTYLKAVDPRTLEMQLKDDKTKLALVKDFAGDKTVKALGITPFSYMGHVYIVGEFEGPGEKVRAEALAKARPEVKEVTFYLLPKPKGKDPTCGTDDNLKLMAKIKSAYIGEKTLESPTLNVRMVQCQAVLLGLVDNPEQIAKAVALAKGVEGVRKVKSFLSVYDPAKDPWSGQ